MTVEDADQERDDRWPALDELADALACHLSPDEQGSGDGRTRARALLEEIGVGHLIDTLTLAERIIRAGQQFHSVERFFVDGSLEQRYLVGLARSAW